MDQLKNLASKASGSSNTHTQQPAAGGVQKEDYLDKGKISFSSLFSLHSN